MKTMKLCLKCAKPLAPDALLGLCPECLMKAGLETEAQPGGAAMSAAPAFDVADLAKHFPQLELLELLGQGGMGVVFKARQPQLDRLVALKIMLPEFAKDPAFAERFTREARALARLNHPSIVAIYDFGHAEPQPSGGAGKPTKALTPALSTPIARTPDPSPVRRERGTDSMGEGGPSTPGEVGLFYFIMEYVDGANLREMLHGGHLTPEQALAIVPRLCDALQFAHDEGLMHRDIKPENILIDKKGRVKIADFGLAKILGQETAGESITVTGMGMGTPKYMAPEQIENAKSVDHRADIYSLGVVFYEMLTGELPLGRFAPPSQKVQVDVRLDEVVLHTLEKEPARRYQHASEVKTAIERVSLAGPIPQGESGSTPDTVARDLLPRLMVTAMAVLLGGLTMAAGVALAVFAILSGSPQSGQFWGWMGGAFGCLCGGGGALIGAINSYRQIAGAGDLMTAMGGNWLDRILGGYALLGGGTIAAAALASSLGSAGRYSLLLLGVIVLGQSVLFWALRRPYRRLVPPVNQSQSEE